MTTDRRTCAQALVERFQIRAESAQFSDPAPGVGDLVSDEMAQARKFRGWVSRVLEETPDLAQREPERLRPLDKANAAERFRPVEAVARLSAATGLHQPLLLVVPQERGSYPRLLRQFTDPEHPYAPALSVHLQVHVKVKPCRARRRDALS